MFLRLDVLVRWLRAARSCARARLQNGKHERTSVPSRRGARVVEPQRDGGAPACGTPWPRVPRARTASRPYCSLKRANVWRAAKVSWLRSATLRQDAVRGGPEAPPYPRPMRAPRDLSRCVPSSTWARKPGGGAGRIVRQRQRQSRGAEPGASSDPRQQVSRNHAAGLSRTCAAVISRLASTPRPGSEARQWWRSGRLLRDRRVPCSDATHRRPPPRA